MAHLKNLWSLLLYMSGLKFLGKSKISSRGQAYVVQGVRKALDVKEGDSLLYYQDSKGQVIVKKA